MMRAVLENPRRNLLCLARRNISKVSKDAVLTYQSEPNCLAHIHFSLQNAHTHQNERRKRLSIVIDVSRCFRAFCSDANFDRRLEDARRNHRQQKHAHRCRSKEEEERRKRLCSTKKGRIVNTKHLRRKGALWAWQHTHISQFCSVASHGKWEGFSSYPQQRKGLVQFNLLH